MITLEEAWERLFALAPRLDGETVPIDEATGRFLLESLVARRTQPAADLSVMDGFALAGSGPWRVVGESRAGHAFAPGIGPGQAVRISTGAVCPDGSDAVLPIEEAELEGETLLAQAPEPGRWIRRRGFDFCEGDPLIAAGQPIGPAQIALARSGGHAGVLVGRRPRVAILECGDELVADPRHCPDDRVPATNGAMVAAMVDGVGGLPRRTGPLPDDRAALVRAFAEAAEADVIVTTAGASVGEHDHVRAALQDAGAELDFWRVAIRPGKPLLAAQLGSTIVLGLPGNPVSSFVTAYLFLLPLLRALQGARHPVPVPVALPLSGSLPPGGERREFRRARFVAGRAAPLPERDSSALATLAAADLLIDRPIGGPSLQDGNAVDCYSLRNIGTA